MQQVRKIQTLESLRNQPFVAPPPLVDWAEELDELGRPWLAMWAAPEGADPKSWMLIDTETQEGQL
ncbi:MAG TPA: hypothetical protein VJ483_05165, partial [Holophagaceae bacterium]|nr:hypothetical protein [Holophagaceae bacterium]